MLSQPIALDPALLVGGVAGLVVALAVRPAARSTPEIRADASPAGAMGADARRVADRRWIGAFLGLVALFALALQTRPALVLYHAVPPLALIQFPWRLQGFVGVALVLLCAFALEAIGASARMGARRWLVLACVALVLPSVFNKGEMAEHGARRLTRAQVEAPDPTTSDAPEYGPRLPGQGNMFEKLTRTHALAGAPSRCPAQWRTDMRREQRRARLLVQCATPGPTRLPIFDPPGLVLSVAGRRLVPMPGGDDPRPLVALPAGDSAIDIRFPRYWPVVRAALGISSSPAP